MFSKPDPLYCLQFVSIGLKLVQAELTKIQDPSSDFMLDPDPKHWRAGVFLFYTWNSPIKSQLNPAFVVSHAHCKKSCKKILAV